MHALLCVTQAAQPHACAPVSSAPLSLVHVHGLPLAPHLPLAPLVSPYACCRCAVWCKRARTLAWRACALSPAVWSGASAQAHLPSESTRAVTAVGLGCRALGGFIVYWLLLAPLHKPTVQADAWDAQQAVISCHQKLTTKEAIEMPESTAWCHRPRLLCTRLSCASQQAWQAI